MNSPGHRENILKPGYQEIGVAAGYGMFEGKQTWLAVQEFGAPIAACPQTSQALAAELDRQKAILENLSAAQELRAKEIAAQKLAISDLEDEYNALAASWTNKNAAREKLAELNAEIAAINQMASEYNAKIQEIRALYDQHKSQVEIYNSQVMAYNSCLGSLK